MKGFYFIIKCAQELLTHIYNLISSSSVDAFVACIHRNVHNNQMQINYSSIKNIQIFDFVLKRNYFGKKHTYMYSLLFYFCVFRTMSVIGRKMCARKKKNVLNDVS